MMMKKTIADMIKMAKTTFVKKARKDIEGTDIKKGDSYYWWKFRFGSKQVSKTRPKRSQLTQSSFLSTMYDVEDTIENINTDDNFEEMVDGIKDELESLKDEQQDSLDNMPEHLQETSSSGELLQERIEYLDEMIDTLENIDFDIDSEQDSDETDEEFEERIEERKEEIITEIQNVSYDGS